MVFETPSLADLATGASALVAATAFAANRLEASKRERFEKAVRQAETIKLFNQRYQELAAQRRALEQRSAPATKQEIASYYQSYWSVQIDCWEHFKLGVLPPITYATWLLYVFDLVRAGVDADARKDGFDDAWIQEEWQSVGQRMSRNNIEFRLLLDQLISLARTQSADLDADFRTSVRERAALRKRLLHVARDALSAPPS
ncbi:MAG TPA: hypothetical protein VG841_08410 [Caulobacterales bacterium]|nr:hypothetical protein [Caulobacterales bacterium]